MNFDLALTCPGFRSVKTNQFTWCIIIAVFKFLVCIELDFLKILLLCRSFRHTFQIIGVSQDERAVCWLFRICRRHILHLYWNKTFRLKKIVIMEREILTSRKRRKRLQRSSHKYFCQFSFALSQGWKDFYTYIKKCFGIFLLSHNISMNNSSLAAYTFCTFFALLVVLICIINFHTSDNRCYIVWLNILWRRPFV